MFSPRFLCAVAVLSASGVPGFAQNPQLVPVIQLSVEESANAKQLAATLKSAKERVKRAEVERQAFYDTYKGSHPDLLDVHFTSDFQMAITLSRATTSTPEVRETLTVQLGPSEKQKLEAVCREAEESKKALDQAQKNWYAFQAQAVVDHIGVSQNGSGSGVVLANGKQVIVPNPWSGWLSFSNDYRLAFPFSF